jgi:dihydroorotase
MTDSELMSVYDGATFDLVLRGGHVVDPANGIDGPMDVGIVDRKVNALGPDLSELPAKRVVDVSGLHVVPGLIDVHVHLYGYKASLTPDVHSFPYGVTTMVDAGGAGWRTFPEFKSRIIDHAKTRVLAFLNVVGMGMIDEVEHYLPGMEPAPTADMIQRYAGVLVGVKTAHYMGTEWDAVDRAVEAGRQSDTPVMVDFRQRLQRRYADLVLEHMRPGDIHTHMYAQHIPLLDPDDTVAEHMWKARERGVLFDLGHGAGSFWWRIATPAMEQGFPPDMLGSDLHAASVLGPDVHMPTVLAKMLTLGMPLDEAIAKATYLPARAIHRTDLGMLGIGAEADVAVLRIREEPRRYVDSGGARNMGTHTVDCLLTLRSGQVVWDPTGMTKPDWRDAGKYLFV